MVLGLCLLGCAENSNGEVEQLKNQIAAMEAEIDAMSDAARVTTTTAARVVTTTRPPRTTTTVSHAHKFTPGEFDALIKYCFDVQDSMLRNIGMRDYECELMVKRITGLDRRDDEAFMRDCNYSDARGWIRDGLRYQTEWPIVIERECGPS